MRRRKGSELATGVLVLVAAAVAVWGYFWLTAQPLGRGGNRLVVQLADADGLKRGDRVRLAGVEVGTVRGLGIRDGSVLAEITVDQELSLPRDSRVSLRSSGAFGGRYLALQPGRSAETLARGDTLGASNAPTLAETFATVGNHASEAFTRASDLLSPDHVASIARGVDELTALAVSLRTTAAGIRRRVDDPRLDSTATDLARTARSLTGTSAELRSASVSLSSILAKIDGGRGSLGRVVNDPTLYQALLTAATHVDDAAVSARALVGDLHARPERYVKVSLF